MKRFCLVINVLFLLIPFCLFASPFNMILVGDPTLDDLRYLSLESGKPFLSFTPPLSSYEIEQYLSSLDISLLTPPAREAYDRIVSRFNPESRVNFSIEYFDFHLNLNSTLELTTRFNSDISWEPIRTRPPAFVSLPMSLFFGNSVLLYIEPAIALSPQYYMNDLHMKNAGINIPLEVNKFDLSTPNRAFIAVGGPWWSFQLGRDRLSFGTGQTGNLNISDNPDYHDFARLSLFSRVIKYSVLVSQMPLDIRNLMEVPPGAEYTRTMHRYYYLHRLDLNLFNRLSVGIMEGALIGNSPLELRFLNPLIIFHQLYSWWNYDYWRAANDRGHNVGSSLSIELNWNIIESLAFYGQFFLNEYSTSHEAKLIPVQPPNGLGYLGGLRYTHSFDTWVSSYFLEFIYTDPYLYMTSTPFASFIHMRYYSMAANRIQYTHLGYARDTIALTLGADFYNRDRLNLGGVFSWISRGEHNKDGLKWTWEESEAAFMESTPTGIAENRFIFSFTAGWRVNQYLVLNGSLAGIFTGNNRHESGSGAAGGQAALSLNFSY